MSEKGGWPMVPHPSDPDDDGASEAPGREANLILPIRLSKMVNIHMIMSETDARVISNTADETARELGAVFVLIRDSLTEFLRSEG